MAITRTANAIVLTAGADVVPERLYITGLTFSGTGLTPGERLFIVDSKNSPLADYTTEVATDNANLWNQPPQMRTGVKFNNFPAGAWRVTVFLG